MKQSILFLIIILLSLSSCDDKSLKEEYGSSQIYMPQATRNLGTDCNLHVTVDPYTLNDISITLGVYRSGSHPLQGFSVEMFINSDTITIAKAIANQSNSPEKYNIYKNAELLSTKYYEPLPSILTVPDGNREHTTTLVLKRTKILEDYNDGTILLLPVQIKNSSKYEINNSLALTMIVVYVDN